MRSLLRSDGIRVTFLCAFCAILLLMGITFGAASAASLPADYRAFISSRIAVVSPADSGEAFASSLSTQIRTGLIITIAGLSVIGVPVILLMLFGRGFVTGFAAGLFARELGSRGVLLAIISLLPSAIIWIPATVFLSAIAILIATIITVHPGSERGKLFLIVRYVILTGVLLLILCLAAVIEAFICPAFMRLASSVIFD